MHLSFKKKRLLVCFSRALSTCFFTVSLWRSCVGVEVTCDADLGRLCQTTNSSRGHVLTHTALSLSLHLSLALIFCLQMSRWNLRHSSCKQLQCTRVGRTRFTRTQNHTHTLLRSVNRWSFVMGLQSLSRSAMLAACHAMPHVSVIRVALTGKPHG